MYRPFSLLIFSVVPLLSFAACSGGQKSDSLAGTAVSVSDRAVIQVKKGDVVRAVIADNHERLLHLLNSGADINENVSYDGDTLTPLIAAVATGNKRLAALLIRNGAAVYPTYRGFSAEDLALYEGDEETASLLEQNKNEKGAR